MALAVLGHVLCSYVFGWENVTIVQLISTFLGTNIGPDFPLRALLLIVLLNIGIAWLYHRKFHDIVYVEDVAQARVRRLAKRAACMV